MISRLRVLPLCIVSLALLSTSAIAQERGNPPRLLLQALDTDHDGKLSSAEIHAAPHTLLSLDLDHDGQLSSSELQPRPENAGAGTDDLLNQLMSFDRNKDGVLTPDELPARMQNLFTRGDTNHDGRLTPDEIRALAAHQAAPAGPPSGRDPRMGRMDPLLSALDTNHDGIISATEIANASTALLTLDRNGDGEITPDELRPRQPGPQERVNHLLEEWDTNKDGKLSKAEAPDRMQQQFTSIDKNGDGFLDQSELLQYFSAAADEGRPERRPRFDRNDSQTHKEHDEE